MTPKLVYQRLTETVPPLAISKPGAATMDLHAADFAVIEASFWGKVSTGISLQIPAGYEAQIRTCHHLAADRGLVVMNSPGTVPSCHEGELYVLVENRDYEDRVCIKPGEKIALLAICPIATVELEEVAIA
jgi:dUTP pyrophosphatase